MAKRLFTKTKTARKAAEAIAGQKVTLKPSAEQKPISFKAGGLHTSTGTPQGKRIPSSKMKEALSGGFGSKAKKQADLKKNVLTGRK